MYLAQMTASQLDTCAITAEWDPDLGWDISKQGFQRAPIPAHFEAIGHFLSDRPNPFMPTAALLSAQEAEKGQLPFQAVGKGSKNGFGILEIPEARYLLILDYQHRLHGLRYAIHNLKAEHIGEFVVPVVIVADIPRYEEIRQFYLINSKQKRIDSALALTLLQTLAPEVDKDELYNLVGSNQRHRVRATPLAFKIAAQSSGPWHGRIAQPHDLPQPNAIMKLTSFVDSLAPIVSKRASISQLKDEEIVRRVNQFWSALAEIVPEAFKTPAGYQIQRTVGAYAFHLVLARRVYPNCEAAGTFSKKAFEQELQPLKRNYLRENFWRRNGPAKVYVGSSGYRELAKLMMEKIPDRT